MSAPLCLVIIANPAGWEGINLIASARNMLGGCETSCDAVFSLRCNLTVIMHWAYIQAYQRFCVVGV